MMTSESPTIAYEDTYCMVATWRSIVMPVMGHAALPAASATRQVRAIAEHGKRIGQGKMAEITLIAFDAPFPDSATRAALDAGVPIVSPFYSCVSAVFEGTGFRGAFVRGMLASFQLLSRTKYPQHVCSSIDDAANWTFMQAKALRTEVGSHDEIAAAAKAVREMAVARSIFSPTAANDAGHEKRAAAR